MLQVCEEWSKEYHIEFSTDEDPNKSKTKVIVIKSRRGRVTTISPLTLDGKELPFVKRGGGLPRTDNY